jgi:hypothetical protein
MAITKVINVDVNTGDANAELEKLEGSFKEVDKAAEKTNKSVDDVAGNGGAIAILDQLTGGLATRFRDAYEASRLFNLSLKGMRTALIATGIGALVVAVGLLVAYWDDIVDYITQANEKLQDNIDLTNDNLSSIEVSLGFNDQILKSLDAQGKSTEEQVKQRIKLIKASQIELIAQNVLLNTQLEKEKSKSRELTLLQKLDNLQRGIYGVAGTASKEELARQKEIAAQINANQKAIIDGQLQINELLNGGDDDDVPLGSGGREQVEGINALTPEDAAILSSAEILDEKLRAITESRYVDEVAEHQAKIRLEQDTANAKQQIQANLFSILGNLAEEGSDLAKGIAASQATINTFQGVTAALSATSVIPDPLGSILKFTNAAAIGVAGLVNVKKILSTKPITKSAPNLGGGGRPSAPSFNLVDGTSQNQISEDIQGINQEPVQAYVVSGDVTTAQNLDNNIITESGI